MTDTPASPSPPQSKEPASKKKKKFSKRDLASSKGVWVLLALFVVLAAAGILWWLHSAQYETTEDATLSGHIHPVSARVGGTIQNVLVTDNQMVRAGQLVAVVDATDYQVALLQAEHNLAQAKAQAQTAFNTIAYTQKQAASQLTQATGGFGTSESGISESRHTVAESAAGVSQERHILTEREADYQKALADYNRYRNVDPEAISAQQLDAATANLRNADAARSAAQASLAQARARLAQSQSSVKSSIAKLTQSKGVIQSAQAQALQLNVVKSQYESAKVAVATAEDGVRQAKLNLSYTQIVAPTSGRVGRKTAEIGQRVQGGEPLMAIVSPDVWVVANFKETQLERMRPGQPVDLHVDTFPRHAFQGRVQSFSPASGAEFALLPPENATGNFTKIVQRVPVKILLDPDSLKGYETLLVPGMSVVVRVNVTEPAKSSKRVAHVGD
jgi:membrane fusion protein (multidrug efflux system)